MLSRFSHVRFCVTLWTVAYQAPVSVGFSRQYTGVDWHALLQGIFLTQGSNPWALTSPALACRFFTASVTWEALFFFKCKCIPNAGWDIFILKLFFLLFYYFVWKLNLSPCLIFVFANLVKKLLSLMTADGEEWKSLRNMILGLSF